MTHNESVARFNRYLDRLDRAETLILARLAAKRAAPIYAEMFKGNQQAGNAAAASKREAGYAKWEEHRKAHGGDGLRASFTWNKRQKVATPR